jgi:hypothetical protein
MPSISHRLPSALKSVARASAIPYGYTVTVWSSGAMLMHRHGLPSPGAVFLFVAGAISAFAGVGLATLAFSANPLEMSQRGTVLTRTMNAASVGAAVGAATLAARVHGVAAWPLGAFAPTSAFLLLSSAALASVHRDAPSDAAERVTR